MIDLVAGSTPVLIAGPSEHIERNIAFLKPRFPVRPGSNGRDSTILKLHPGSINHPGQIPGDSGVRPRGMIVAPEETVAAETTYPVPTGTGQIGQDNGENGHYSVTFSQRSLELAGLAGAEQGEVEEKQAEQKEDTEGAQVPGQLTEEARREVMELRARDREVRAHEMAHRMAAGDLVRGHQNFEYEEGPDGRRYAVGGEVSIDASPVKGDPHATARKMERVRRAALAPAKPSAQDRKVAARAAAAAAKARTEIARENLESGDIEQTGETSTAPGITQPGQRGEPGTAATGQAGALDRFNPPELNPVAGSYFTLDTII